MAATTERTASASPAAVGGNRRNVLAVVATVVALGVVGLLAASELAASSGPHVVVPQPLAHEPQSIDTVSPQQRSILTGGAALRASEGVVRPPNLPALRGGDALPTSDAVSHTRAAHSPKPAPKPAPTLVLQQGRSAYTRLVRALSSGPSSNCTFAAIRKAATGREPRVWSPQAVRAIKQWRRLQARAAHMVERGEEMRALTWSCDGPKVCGGMGDRLMGIAASWWMAFLSDRAFYISHHKPVDLETVFEPNGVNWRFTKSMQALLWVPVNAMVYNRDVEGMDGYEAVLTSYQKLITIKTNRPLNINQDFMHRMARAVPEEKLAVAKEMNFSIQFVLDMLFRPSQALKDHMLSFIESSRSAWDQPFTPCMHIRTGRADKRNSLALVDYIVHVGALRRLLRAPLVQGMPALAPGNGHITAYVASDDKSSVASLAQAAALDPDTSAQYSFRQIELDQFHVDKPKANNPDPAVRTGFIKAVADQQLLTLCDAWVLGKSGFGQVAAAWADPRPIDALAIIVEAVRPSGHVMYRAPRAKDEHVWIHSSPLFEWDDEPPLAYNMEQGAVTRTSLSLVAVPSSPSPSRATTSSGQVVVSLMRHHSLRSACARKIKGKRAPWGVLVFKFPERILRPANVDAGQCGTHAEAAALELVDHVPKYVPATSYRKCLHVDNAEEVAALMYKAELDRAYTATEALRMRQQFKVALRELLKRNETTAVNAGIMLK